jgi:hypothetical protein
MPKSEPPSIAIAVMMKRQPMGKICASQWEKQGLPHFACEREGDMENTCHQLCNQIADANTIRFA